MNFTCTPCIYYRLWKYLVFFSHILSWFAQMCIAEWFVLWSPGLIFGNSFSILVFQPEPWCLGIWKILQWKFLFLTSVEGNRETSSNKMCCFWSCLYGDLRIQKSQNIFSYARIVITATKNWRTLNQSLSLDMFLGKINDDYWIFPKNTSLLKSADWSFFSPWLKCFTWKELFWRLQKVCE
jgi:hypothetical protein